MNFANASGGVLNAPLTPTLSFKSSQIEFLLLCCHMIALLDIT